MRAVRGTWQPRTTLAGVLRAVHPLLLLLLLHLVLTPPGASAAPASEAGASTSVVEPARRALESGVRLHRLANGMTFLLLERHAAPIFSGVIRLRVGGMDEEAGQSGLAHLFEHLAFKGTNRIGVRDATREPEILDAIEEQVSILVEEEGRVPPDPQRLSRARERLAELQKEHARLSVPNEFLELYTASGGVGLNASTNKDLTSYYISLPANRLELWCLMESERLRDGVVREFYPERDVVMEERRLRVEAQPFGVLHEALLARAFGDTPYGVPTVGRMDDLRRLRTAQALEFRRRHYRPENAVVALVGDFQIDQALRLISTYFGDWRGEAASAPPAAAAPPAEARAAGDPPPAGEPRQVRVEFDSEPYLLVGYEKPVHPHPDAAVFEVLEGLLTSGRTSLLYKDLVVERRMALEVFAFETPGQRRENLFVIGAIPQAPHSAAEVESAILEKLGELAASPVAQHDLEKVRNRFETSFLDGLSSNLGLALQLSHAQILLGDWREILRLLERVSRLGPEEVRTVASRYLTAGRRVTAELVPRAPPPPDGAAGGPQGQP